MLHIMVCNTYMYAYFLLILTFLRTDRSIKDGVSKIPVVSILCTELVALLKQNRISSPEREALISKLSSIYQDTSKSSLQTFISSKCNTGLTKIPPRSSSDAVYLRCLQIYKSAFSKSTLKVLENGQLVQNIIENYIILINHIAKCS